MFQKKSYTLTAAMNFYFVHQRKAVAFFGFLTTLRAWACGEVWFWNTPQMASLLGT